MNRLIIGRVRAKRCENLPSFLVAGPEKGFRESLASEGYSLKTPAALSSSMSDRE